MKPEEPIVRLPRPPRSAFRVGWPVLALAISAGGLRGQETPATPIFVSARTLTQAALHVPAGIREGDRVTLFVALHGYGGSARRFARIGELLSESGAVAALPQAAHPVTFEDGSRGFDWSLASVPDSSLHRRATELAVLEQLPQLMGELRRRFEVDRTYVVGFSQGAIIALLVGLYRPDLVDGAATFGLPGFDPSWFPEGTLEAGVGVRVWLGHGAQDARASPSVSRSAADFLRSAGLSVTEHSFEGGHAIPTDALEAMVAWSRGSGDP